MNSHELKLKCGQSDLWPLFYPRVYRDIDAFGDPKTAAYALTIEAEGVRSGVLNRNQAVISIPKLIATKMPTLFIDRKFAAVAAMSTPPDDLRWDEMRLPFEAGLLMLPRKWLLHPKFGECQFLGWGRYAGAVGRDLGDGMELDVDDDVFNVFTAFQTDAGFPVMQTLIMAAKNPTLGDLRYTPEERFFVDDDQSPFGLYATSGDFDFMEQVVSLTFSLLLAITARPMLIENGRRQGRHKKPGLPIWTPNIVGRDYQYRSGTSGEHQGGTVRMHWRRGHFRSQPFGPGLSDRKIIWIEPTLIGGEK